MRSALTAFGIVAALPAVAADLRFVAPPPDAVIVERRIAIRPHGSGPHRPHVPDLPYGGLRRAHAPELPYGGLGRAHAPDLPYGGLATSAAPVRRVRGPVVSVRG
ncbi:MAG TPA: hypothetical protein VHL98_00905 [Microvirga sp.]|jgi:hypothetical protein|nr:hypothetical protein [Microvirga sp.]